jgi:hypothetical protein
MRTEVLTKNLERTEVLTKNLETKNLERTEVLTKNLFDRPPMSLPAPMQKGADVFCSHSLSKSCKLFSYFWQLLYRRGFYIYGAGCPF